jgi:DNA (cytosine-5)-methyltransferase 1
MTLCSGIGAPEMAAPWVDWRLASEVEAFPRAVLQQRLGYKLPADHNQGEPLLWGDMTEVTPDLLRDHGIPLPDILVAGTPCQAFSVAGLRQGVADARGNLTLKFVETCHAIVAARPDGRLVVLWENVPGVLSDSDNAFGHFLGGLVGAMDALRPPGDGSWPGEGMVQGPRARAAWAVLDAQHFGVAQRRRRVFVVVDFGGACDPAAVLLEPESLRGNPPSRGEARQVAPCIPARSLGGGGLGTDFDCDGGLIPEIVGTLSDGAHNGGGLNGQDAYSGRIIPVVTHSLSADGFDASDDGTGRGTPLVPVVAGTMKACSESGGFSNSADHAAAGYMIPVPVAYDVAPPITSNPYGDHEAREGLLVATAYRTTGNDGVYETGDLGGALTTTTDPNAQIVAFSSKDHGADAMSDLSPTLRAGGHDGSHANAGVPPAIAFQDRFRGDDGRGYSRTPPVSLDVVGSLETVKPWHVATAWAVRRLTPTECHRLQGFPDDHTAITYRGKPAADGPQYKALGNSMAVPCVAWIMDRIRISAGWV